MEKTTHHLSIHRETLVDKIVDIIESQILTGKLEPGTKLSEASVTKEFNVSRAPAREALLRLEDVNLLGKNHMGRAVAEFSIEEFREIYEIKNIIEAYAAIQAAETTTERDLNKLKSILSEMENNLNPPDHKRLIKLNNEFHNHIVHCFKNSKLIELYDIKVKQVRWTSVNYKRRPQFSVKDHKKICEAFLKRDGNSMRTLMENHTMRSMERIITEMKSKNKSQN